MLPAKCGNVWMVKSRFFMFKITFLTLVVSMEIAICDCSIMFNPNADLYIYILYYIYTLNIYIYTLNIYIYPQYIYIPSIYIYIYLQYIYNMYLYYDSYFFRARHISSPRSTKALRSSGDLSSRWKLSSPCKDCFLQRQAFECDVGET